MTKEKKHINVAFIGHVDHGKSTIMGRMLLEHGDIKKDIIEKFERMGEKGKSFKYAWVMDQTKEERARGLTIEAAHRMFETPSNAIWVADCPGHKDFVKNMVTGASRADATVVVIDAEDGVMPQTREHTFLVRALGLKQLIVVINKMDLVDYKQEAYEKVKKDISSLMERIGYDTSKIAFIPVSGFEGENLTSKSEKIPWYHGDTLYEALDKLEEPYKPADQALRFPLHDVYMIKGVGSIPVGRIETGTLKVGDVVMFEPASTIYSKKIKGEVRSMEMNHEHVKVAFPGYNVGISVRGVGRDHIRRGDVVSHPDSPPTVLTNKDTFIANVVVLDHPSGIHVGYAPDLHVHTARVTCRFEKILTKLDPKTGRTIEKTPAYLRSGEAGVTEIRPTRPIVIEEVEKIPQMGRFAVRDMGVTVAAGMCIQIKYGVE
jgi:elongation factor 1-alpha